MDQFRDSLIRGTRHQAAQNSNKAQILADYLKAENVEALKELSDEKLMRINILVMNTGAKVEAPFKESLWIGQAIEADRAKGKNFNH